MQIITEKGFFVPTKIRDICPVFEKYLRTDHRFMDLGAGDGRIVRLASEFCIEARGIESDEALAIDKTGIIFNDFMQYGFDWPDVLYYYALGCKQENALLGKIDLEGKGLLIVYWPECIESQRLNFINRLHSFYLIEQTDKFAVFKKGGN